MQENITELASVVEYQLIDGFPGYRIGDDVSVWTRWIKGGHGSIGNEWHKLKTWINAYGYLCITRRKGGRKYNKFVHRLLLAAFVGPCPEGMEGWRDAITMAIKQITIYITSDGARSKAMRRIKICTVRTTKASIMECVN